MGMKYALVDGEIHIHQRDQDTYWPLSLEEAQHVVDVMNNTELLRAVIDAGAVPTDMLPRALALLDETVED